MIGYIHDDVFRQTRLLPPGVTVKVRFVRATEQFSLISTRAGYKTEISSAILYVKKCKVNPEVCLALANVHKKNNMYFPIKRVDCKVFICFQRRYHLWTASKEDCGWVCT